MANICDFSMKIRGKKDDCISFFNALTQNGNVYMGRGAEAEIVDEYDENNNHYMQLDGWCKWSIVSSLIDNAISMRENPEKWSFGDTDTSNLEFVTLDEVCAKYNVDCEVYSSECGFEFQEHYLILDGVICISDCVDYREICLCDYETREEAEGVLGRKITDEEWANKDDYISNGGLTWDFEI